MELPRDSVFEAEAARYGLRFRCEDCGLFDAARGCAHGYPTERHRESTADPRWLVFCKDFDAA